MKTIKEIYNLLKKHWVLTCVFIIVFIIAFYPEGKTPTQYSNYTQVSEEAVPVTPSTPDIQELISEVEAKTLTGRDYIYAQATIDFIKKYPWYEKMPINTQEYLIVYDLDKSSFRIVLKMSPTSPESQKNAAINSALQDIKSIGADSTKYYTVFEQPAKNP